MISVRGWSKRKSKLQHLLLLICKRWCCRSAGTICTVYVALEWMPLSSLSSSVSMKSLLTSGGGVDEPGGSSAIELEPVLAIGASTAGAAELDPGL